MLERKPRAPGLRMEFKILFSVCRCSQRAQQESIQVLGLWGGPSFTENFEPVQNGLSLPGAVCFLKLRPSESSLGQLSRGGPQQPPLQSSQSCMTSWAPRDRVLQHSSTQTEPRAIQHSVQDPQEQMQQSALFTEQSTSTETLISLIPGGYAGVTSSLGRL